MPRNPDKKPCSVPDCRAWAMRDSNPPLCASHNPGLVGAPLGNRNALTHGFYASALHPDDLKELDEAAFDTTLNDEIIVLRIALRRLQRMVLTGLTPDPDPQHLDVQDYARFIGLIFQGINTLSRLLRVRHDLPGNDRWEEIVNWTLDALSEEWGIEL
jgi:hypothetical protein